MGRCESLYGGKYTPRISAAKTLAAKKTRKTAKQSESFFFIFSPLNNFAKELIEYQRI